jgi:hypothetical protein
MEGLGRLLPAKFIVLAKNIRMFMDFMSVINRPTRDGIFANHADSLRGLAKDPVVVQIGHYYEHDEFVEISRVLDGLGRLTNVTVSDWR